MPEVVPVPADRLTPGTQASSPRPCLHWHLEGPKRRLPRRVGLVGGFQGDLSQALQASTGKGPRGEAASQTREVVLADLAGCQVALQPNLLPLLGLPLPPQGSVAVQLLDVLHQLRPQPRRLLLGPCLVGFPSRNRQGSKDRGMLLHDLLPKLVGEGLAGASLCSQGSITVPEKDLPA
eukprot:15435443-Alexandrium_andersonii.AAC.1